MRSLSVTTLTRGAAAALLALPALLGSAAGQLPNPSAAALGMGDNHTAAARGFDAVVWNPAGLGMPGNPLVSAALLPVRGIAGLDPVTVADFQQYEGEFVPREVREQWLQEITAEGGEQGSAGMDVTYFAASFGRFGLQLGSSARTIGNIAPDAAEILLFGNAGRTGEPRDFDLRGSTLDFAATSSGAISYAQPIPVGGSRHFAIGATVKYTIGHVLVTGESRRGELRAEPLELDFEFPVVHSSFSQWMENGSGVGLDLGAAWQSGRLGAGVAVQNLVSTFEWNEEKFSYRPGQATFSTDTASTDFEEQPLSTAPESVQGLVDGLGFGPVVSAGLSYQATPGVTVVADFRQQLEEGLQFNPDTHAGVGVEVGVLRWLPLRVGAAAISGGYLVSGGLGLRLGGFEIAAGAARRESDLGTDLVGAFSLTSRRH